MRVLSLSFNGRIWIIWACLWNGFIPFVLYIPRKMNFSYIVGLGQWYTNGRLKKNVAWYATSREDTYDIFG